MDIEKILKVAVRGGASEVFLKVGAIPRFRFNGELINLTDGLEVTDTLIREWIQMLLPAHLQGRQSQTGDLDFSYQTEQGARFRVNLFRQRGGFGLVLRVLTGHVRTMEELQMPQVVARLAQEKRGLMLVTGATGSGKSTTLAAIVEKINQSRAAHIITVEDPIEVIYKEKLSTINQREIGVDTPSFIAALRSALRQSPDVILVGELRDRETTETALMAAETGHLVLATLHTQDAPEAFSRLLSYFPAEGHATIRLMISQTIKAVISQRLVPRADAQGMIAAVEVLTANETVRGLIASSESFRSLKDVIKAGGDTYGMQSFDQSLLHLAKIGTITSEIALAYASERKDLIMALSGIG